MFRKRSSLVGSGHVPSESLDDITNMASSSSEGSPLLGRMSPKDGMEGKKTFQYVGALAACMSSMAAGSTMGWTSAASSLTDEKEEFHITDDEFSWVGAVLSLGAVIAVIPLGSLANLLGRKKLLIALVPLMVVGWALLAWANSLLLLLVGRFVLGSVTGTFCVVAPMYTAEIAEDSIRGALGSLFQLLMTVGILFVYILDALNVDLFITNLLCGCIPIVMGILMTFLPDSPRWYLSKDLKDEAEKSLKFYRGRSNVSKELESIQNGINEENEQQIPFTKAFTAKSAKKGLLLSVSLMFLQQFCGINAVIFYGSQIFTDAGVGLDPSVSTAIIGVCMVFATCGSTLLIDRLGRRILLMMSGAIMALSGAVLGLYFYLDYIKFTEKVDLSWLPIVCLVVFIVMFSLGFGPVPWLYMGEIFPDQIKGPAMSITTVVNWFSVFIITKFYTQMKEAIGIYSTFWIFAAISFASCFFIYFLLVETKGKSFSQIIAELSGESAASSLSNETVNAGNRDTDTENARY